MTHRYDLLCLEGLAQALQTFIGLDPIPVYTVANIKGESMLKMHIKPEVHCINQLLFFVMGNDYLFIFFIIVITFF